MTDEQEHSRVRTVLDDVADANTTRTMERLAQGHVLTDKELSERGWAHTLVFSSGPNADWRMEQYPEQVAKHIVWADTDPHIHNDGKPLRIRGMVEDGKLTLPGEHKDG
jgi:hypothetical protein